MNMSIKDKAALGRANTKKEQNKIITREVNLSDGSSLMQVSKDGGMTFEDMNTGEGMGRLSEKERVMIASAIGKAGRESRLPSEPDLTKRAKGGMINKYAKGGEVKKYMGGGSVHKKKNKMATTKGWGASRKT